MTRRERHADAVRGIYAIVAPGQTTIGDSVRGFAVIAMSMLSAQLRAQGEHWQAGGRKGKATQRKDAQTFADAIAAIRRERPHLSDAAAIRLHLIDLGETPTETRIASERRRLTRARARTRK